jgi:hypothetical protein
MNGGRCSSHCSPQASQAPGSCPPLPDRKALTGILFVLKTGIQWEFLIDWSRASRDSASVPAPHAPKGARQLGQRWGPTPQMRHRVKNTLNNFWTAAI